MSYLRLVYLTGIIFRYLNGAINIGSDMFSNGLIAPARRGLAELGALDTGTIMATSQQQVGVGDTNGTHTETVTSFVATMGDISTKDPVFNQLEVWQDANSNGQVDDGELHPLANLGITDLNYTIGTFTINGQTHRMETADLTADMWRDAVNEANLVRIA